MNYSGEVWSRMVVLAVIMGIRAGEMHVLDYIDLPEGEGGEEEVAAYILEEVAKYTGEVDFDTFIEASLERRYGC